MEAPLQHLISRRAWLLAAAGACTAASTAGAAEPLPSEVSASRHFPLGPVVPGRALERWPVVTQLGAAVELPQLLRGKVSALHLMFTGCSATCPIQGALFAQAQQLLGGPVPDLQFVSLSIDPLGDTPAALRAWLQRQSAGPGWLAAVPRMADVEAIVERLGQGGEKRPAGADRHVTQVYIFDRQAELVWRTASLPSAGQIVDALRHHASMPTMADRPAGAGDRNPSRTFSGR